jgi:hypothetical protein
MCLVNPNYAAIELARPVCMPQTCDCVIVKLNSIASVLVVVYRPPCCTSEDTESLLEAFDCVLKLGYHTTIMGDLNMPGIDWSSSPPQAVGAAAFALVELAASWDMSQIVPEPTRGDNYLDIILTTTPSGYSHCYTQPPVASSDHLLVVCQLSNPRRFSQQFVDRRSRTHINYDKLRECLAATSWTTLDTIVDVDAQWEVFREAVVRAMEQCTVSTLPRAVYVSRKLRSLFLRKKRRWKRMKLNPTSRNKQRFKSAAKHLTRSIRVYKMRDEEAMLRTSPARFFKYVTSHLTQRQDHIVLKKVDGESVSDSLAICQELMAEFTKNFSLPDDSTSVSIAPTCNSAFQMELCLEELLKIVSGLSNTAAGPDGIPALVYRRCVGSLARPLLAIFKHSLYSGTVPAAWKLAKVYPLYKGKGDKSIASSYRPVSLTCVACKILERLLITHLNAYLNSNYMLDSRQHGFRNGQSTVTNLLSFDKHIVKHLNDGKPCDVIMIDFSRAFDKVNHLKLCVKLKRLGIDGCYLKWIVDYLSNRKQYVIYGGALSSMSDVTSGVVQGSCLGPVAFSIFINDLCAVLNYAEPALFADDFKFVGDVSCQLGRTSMQADIDAVATWSDTNQLPINLDKCTVLHYGRNNVKQEYSLGAAVITSTSCNMDLGVLRSDSFSYDEHVRSVALKASRMAGMTLKLFNTRDAEFLRRLYVAYIRPMLEYASPVWSPLTVSTSILLERVQRRYTKRVRGMTNLPYDQRLQLLHLETLAQRRTVSDMVLTYKSLRGLTPVLPATLGLQVSSAPTRSCGLKLETLRPSNKLLSNCFQCRAPKQWNSLPKNVLRCRTVNVFKASTIEHLSSIANK